MLTLFRRRWYTMSGVSSQTENHAKNLLTASLDPNFKYHNLTHTQRVVESVQKLVEFYSLSDLDAEALLLSAWLHDIGYIRNPEKHEDASIEMARVFLEEHNYPEDQIKKVETLIAATKMGYEPMGLLEEIIRDADCSHFGQESYRETAESLRQELAKRGVVEYSLGEWSQRNIEVLRDEHQYYTSYALQNWDSIKQNNIKSLLMDRRFWQKITKNV